MVTKSTVTSRRALTRAAVIGGGATALVVAAPSLAQAATTYTPVAYTNTPILGAADLHIVKRFTFGYSSALRADIVAVGGITNWLNRQFTMTAVDDSFYGESATWWTCINASKDTLWQRHVSSTEPLWWAAANYEKWCLVRQIHSRRQVQEVLTEFWEHHFNAPSNGSPWSLWRTEYGKGLRSRSLGTFRDLLKFAVVHPTMQQYLGNYNSNKTHPNENLARELLELHTVGRGNYTETDIQNVARLLTGWTCDNWQTWTPGYNTTAHATGAVKIMGFTDANSSTDGRAAVDRLLDYLATHPATAQRVARKLAIRFVSDAPSQALVDSLAKVYLDNGSSIVPVLRAIIASTEFKAAAGKKVRTPSEDVVATHRALGVVVKKPTQAGAAADTLGWQCEGIGHPIYRWPQPDGRPDKAEAWTSTGRFLGSLENHYALSGGWWPNVDVSYRSASSWLPTSSIRFDQWVDHLARSVNGAPSTSLLLQACCEATGCQPGDTITAQHPTVVYAICRILTVFLDHPNHITR
jgi:hypothetical protein